MTKKKPDQMHDIYSEDYWKLFEYLDKPLPARTPDLLHELAEKYITTGAHILDAGCRDAAHLIRLVNDHNGTGVGIDPVAWHIDRARALVSEAGLDKEIKLVKGVIEDLPFSDDQFDFIWCRDVLEIVEPLQAAFRESARVLKPGGHMLVYTNFATELLSSHEMKMIKELGNSSASMMETNVDDAFKKAGFSIVLKDIVGTEWREHQEPETHLASRDLLRLARLRRQRQQIIEKYGEDVYKTTEASVHWLIFQFLGKITPVVYILKLDK